MTNEAFEAVTRSSSRWRPWSPRCEARCLRPGYCFFFVFDKDTIIASHWENTKYHPVPRWCPKRNYKRIWRRPPASTTCHYVDAKPAKKQISRPLPTKLIWNAFFSLLLFFRGFKLNLYAFFFCLWIFCSMYLRGVWEGHASCRRWIEAVFCLIVYVCHHTSTRVSHNSPWWSIATVQQQRVVRGIDGILPSFL